MQKYLILIAVAVLDSVLVLAQICDESSPITKTKSGDVRGTVFKSRKGKAFAAFRGIPYAQPPVGDLRFKPPKEIDKWKGVRNATEDAPICIQQDFLFHKDPQIEGSEDCLYLNVYTPKNKCPSDEQRHHSLNPNTQESPPLTGGKPHDSPSIIDVGFCRIKIKSLTNHYLSTGFFTTYDDEAPGNWAFKDQVAALKWVHNNIHYFGGSNKKITIAGQSAGAGSVHHLLLSPTTKGLFQSAITLSGSALALWAKPMSRELFVVTNVTAQTVGCSFPDTKSMVECLRKIPARDLVNAVNVFRQFIKSEPLTPYFPAIEEKSAGNPEPFITEQPVDIIKKGDFHNVPWMIGVVSNEGILRSAPFVRQEDVRLKINKDFDQLKDMLAIRLSVEPGLIDSFWTDVKEFYFKGKDNLNDTKAITGLTNVYGDRAFIYPTYQSMQLHKQMGHKHIFAYNFNYRGKYSYGDLFAGTNNNLLNYKWGFPIATISFTPCSLQEDLRITNFPGPIWMLIRFRSIYLIRDPTPEHLYQDRQRWEELPHTDSLLTEEELHFMEISGGFEEGAYSLNLTNGFYTDRMRFWATKPLAENRVFNALFDGYFYPGLPVIGHGCPITITWSPIIIIVLFFKFKMHKERTCDIDLIEKAVQEIKSGQGSYRTVSQKYGIPRSSVEFELKHTSYRDSFEPPSVLSEQEENFLTKWIPDLAENGFPRKREDILSSVQNFLQNNRRKNTFGK
ncbi:carboxylic ester hydrolase [Holotrichia oblita]|uniref:Carboxylic ester hydrolase n=1 Tax=Holotrichia oblita TaxID=644536 RepID=A0ACB9THW3_HOLOL|nr:carboxylic ester hydrolase [Holotrichia oblita]